MFGRQEGQVAPAAGMGDSDPQKIRGIRGHLHGNQGFYDTPGSRPAPGAWEEIVRGPWDSCAGSKCWGDPELTGPQALLPCRSKSSSPLPVTGSGQESSFLPVSWSSCCKPLVTALSRAISLKGAILSPLMWWSGMLDPTPQTRGRTQRGPAHEERARESIRRD